MSSTDYTTRKNAPKPMQQAWTVAGFNAKRGMANPYKPDTLARECWQHGYDCARQIERQA